MKKWFYITLFCCFAVLQYSTASAVNRAVRYIPGKDISFNRQFIQNDHYSYHVVPSSGIKNPLHHKKRGIKVIEPIIPPSPEKSLFGFIIKHANPFFVEGCHHTRALFHANGKRGPPKGKNC